MAHLTTRSARLLRTMRKPGCRTSGASPSLRSRRSCRIYCWCSFWSFVRWVYWGLAKHDRIDFKRSAALPGPQRKTEVLWNLGSRRPAAVGAAEDFRFGGGSDDLSPDRHLHHLLPFLQHSSRPNRAAFVRARRLLRPWRLSSDSRYQHYKRQQASDPATRHSPGRRLDGTILRCPAWLGFDPA